MEDNIVRSARVLVIDDNPAKRYVLCQILRSGGFNVVEATCGADGLAQAEAKPDLVILDVDLPDIDGREVCRRIKASPATSHIPVLHVSGKFITGDDKADGLEGGADGYITEPIEPRELRAAVAALLRVRKAEAALMRANATLQAEIAERNRVERGLYEQQVFQRQAIDLNPSLIFVKDRGGRFTLANEATARAYGTTVGELLGKTEADFNADRVQVEKHLADDLDVMETLRERRIEDESIADPAGRIRRLQTVKRPLIGPDGKADQVLAVCTDITELKAVESALRQATGDAEAANRSKSEFLANMSHEIRTPMTAILGYADMLAAPALSEAKRLECVRTIRRQGEHLLNILNDILDLSKIEAGKLTLERICCAPFDIVNEAVSLMRVRASEKKIQVHVSCAGPVPQTIQTDPTRLRQILINLLGNAVKFTQSGWVHVSVGIDRAPGSGGTKLLMEVIDSGIGMSEEETARLFRPFAQADSSTTRRFGGTGLGLTICRRLAQMLGGDITCRSEPGRGSRFTVRIEIGDSEGVPMMSEPPEAVNDVAPPPAGASQLRGRILVADDAVHNRAVVGFYLREAGLEVVEAKNGRVAYEQAMAAAAAGRPFDAILMDMQMPVLDGYGATTMLRDNGYRGPIIAFTAHAMTGEREKCVSAGCSDYLSKPVDRNRLIDVIANIVGRTTRDATASAVVRAPEPSPAAAPHVDPSIAQFLPLFLAQLPAQVEQMTASLAARDTAALALTVHQLKGSGGMYGYMDVTDAASKVETLIDRQAALEAIDAEVRTLISLIGRIDGYVPAAGPAAAKVGGAR